MKYGTNASHEQYQRSARCAEAQRTGWASAFSGNPNTFRPGTPEHAAFHRGAELAAFDARHIWA